MPPSGSRPKADPRRRAEKAGRAAERGAAWFLTLKFYKIVATRYKTPVGEIDLVAKKGRVIVFVEVKQRARADGESRRQALEAVDTARIVRAAQWFQSRHPQFAGFDFRFDVISMAPGHWPHHLIHAFSA